MAPKDLIAESKPHWVLVERQRIQDEYQRRHQELDTDRYAFWQPAETFITSQRKRVGAVMLHRADAFPKPGDKCLEIGFGSLGWLGDLISWGVKETNLHGIELDADRARRAQERLPMADLRVGDATDLPWSDNFFQLVIVSTVFTSILDQRMRVMVANEIMRVLAPWGTLLWYDFAVNNPRNPNVRKVSRRELKELFPQLEGSVKRVTLAPPIVRIVAPRSWTLATLIETIPLFRTHLLGVLAKKTETGPGRTVPA